MTFPLLPFRLEFRNQSIRLLTLIGSDKMRYKIRFDFRGLWVLFVGRVARHFVFLSLFFDHFFFIIDYHFFDRSLEAVAMD